MNIIDRLTKEVVLKSQYDDYVKWAKATIDAYEDVKETLAKRNESLLSTSSKMLAESEMLTDALKEEVFETNARYGKLLKLVRECVNDKKYKALKDYVDAYDRGEMFLISDKWISEGDELTDDVFEALVDLCEEDG